LGNRSAYSTTAFATAYPTLSSSPSRRACPPHAAPAAAQAAPAVGRGAAGGGAVRMAEETDTMLQPTQGGGREGGCNASYKRS
jgi:hypothetical protein